MITLENMRTASICYEVDIAEDTYQLDVIYSNTAGVRFVEVSRNLIHLETFDSVAKALSYVNTYLKVESRP